jgi:hypothetical protein
LHQLIDDLPESMLESAATILEIFVHPSDHPAWAAMRRALAESQPERLSDADREAIREAYDEVQNGARLLSHEEVERRWREAE